MGGGDDDNEHANAHGVPWQLIDEDFAECRPDRWSGSEGGSFPGYPTSGRVYICLNAKKPPG
jgi:hypothetical protein